VAATTPVSSPTFWNAWAWWLIPALTALLLVLYFVDPFIGDWDGMDYTMLSLSGYPSSMALGRNLFIFGNHALYGIAHWLFNVQPDNAYLIFKYAVVAQVPLAVIGCWVLARDFTGSIHSATLAALFVVFSPVFVLYGGQVMTDVPAILLLTTALIIHYRGWQQERVWMVMLGAALLGLGMNLRETQAPHRPFDSALGPFVSALRRGLVRLLVSYRRTLPCDLVWLAGIDATGNRAASSHAAKPQALSDVFLCQRTGRVSDNPVCSAQRMARAQVFAAARTRSFRTVSRPAAIS